jgi:hypothetical protein
MFNLMVINTARWAAPEAATQFPTMLIVDECHRAGSSSNALALTGPHVAALGMSATPWREYDDAFEAVIAPALGPIVFSYGVDDASADGIISPFDLVNVGVDLLPDEAVEYERLTARLRRLGRHGDSEDSRDGDSGSGDDVAKALLLKRAVAPRPRERDYSWSRTDAGSAAARRVARLGGVHQDARGDLPSGSGQAGLQLRKHTIRSPRSRSRPVIRTCGLCLCICGPPGTTNNGPVLPGTGASRTQTGGLLGAIRERMGSVGTRGDG